MQVDEILNKVQFVVDPKTGNKSAVLIDYARWEELLTLLQGVGDAEEAKEGLGPNDKRLRPFGLCAGAFTVPDDFDDPLPEHVIEEFEGRR